MAVRINLGTSVYDYNNGLKIENIPLQYLKDNVLIYGKDHSEKSALLSHILNQFYARTPDIGVLYIKLSSMENLRLFHLDKVYEYGDHELEIPYFYGNALSDVNREHYEYIINAVFGFHFELRIVIGCVLLNYKVGRFPSSIVDFLNDVKSYLIEHPYHEEFNNSNIRGIDKAIEFMQEDPLLERTLWRHLDTPQWLRLWSEGQKICIDLSDCELAHQKILVPLLLQTVKEHTPLRASDIPTGFVVLEDTDDLLRKPPYDEYMRNFAINKKYYYQYEQEAYFLTREQLEKVYDDKDYLYNVQSEKIFTDLILDKLNYRNISFITTCQDKSRIFDDFRNYSQIRIKLD